MSTLPQRLLSQALHIRWGTDRSPDWRAAEGLEDRVPGFSAAQYAEADRRAAALDAEAYDLASAWFASRGQGEYPSVDLLKARHPGFPDADYDLAIHNNIMWARK